MQDKTSSNTNPKRKIFLIITGYIILYAVFELTSRLTGDLIKPENAFIVTACVLFCAVTIESLFFKTKLSSIFGKLGFGKPGIKAITASVVITLLLFLCYPVITAITGYKFKLPENWIWLAVGVFALHGIAEEVLYRGFLFRRLREGRSFGKAAWLAVIFFTAAHIPIIINMGILVGGMAVLLAVVSSFPFSYMYEKGGNTIWAPAIVHFAIDTVIPILAAGPQDASSTQAVTIWMAASMVIPYLVFIIIKPVKSVKTEKKY